MMNRRVNKQAFSLVEVVLAIGIMAFGLIVIIGLLPAGLRSNRDSTEESQAVNLMQAVIADRQATDYALASAIYGVPALRGDDSPLASGTVFSGSCYIADSGSASADGNADSRYLVAYTVWSSTEAPIEALMNIRVSWPAQQPNPLSRVESTATFAQP
ncbi:MAG: hypothetical protein LBK71_09150 [Verrucomicrobiales bacterium]|jgi:type II secretory pathway pseudopilin PulG|nr:hypothetical protein [Verrucomicrobiales bacterium]